MIMEVMGTDTEQTDQRFGCTELGQPRTNQSESNAKNRHTKSRTDQIEKVIKDLQQQKIQIEEQMQEIEFGQRNAMLKQQYEELRYGSWEFNNKYWRPMKWTRPDYWRKSELDKLTFANGAYRKKTSITSWSSGELEVNIHNLHYQILHGARNVDAERCLLKMLNLKKHNKECHLSLEEIQDRISGLNYQLEPWRGTSSSDKEKISKELEKLEWERESAYANAPVKGKLWNPFETKKELQKQIKMERKRHEEEAMKEVLEKMKKKDSMKRETKRAEKDLKSLEKKLMIIRLKTYKATLCLKEQMNHFTR